MKANSRYKTTRYFSLFWSLFIGLGAIYGSIMMLIDKSGKLLAMDSMLPYFSKLPFSQILFQDYLFSGIALLAVNGITNITAFILLLKNKKSGVISSFLFGITLMLWITIQFYIFPFNYLSFSYFIFGLIQALTGYALFVFYTQESFTFNLSDYKEIGKDSKRIVVYFSRMGYVKKIAYEIANKTKAQIYEIKAKERTEGTLGFWWCGRFALHRWDMAIEEVNVDFAQFDEVTICTPIWSFSLSSPIHSFCRMVNGKIKKVNYFLVHYTNLEYKNVIDELDTLLSIKHNSVSSITLHMGRIKNIKEVIK